MTAILVDTGPLDWRIGIVDKAGRPTPEFQRRWNSQRNNNTLISNSIGVFSGIIATTALSGERAVAVNASNQIIYPNITILADGQGIIGITTSAISAGGSGQVQMSGIMNEPSWSWTPGKVIWVTNNGVLSQVPPPTGKWILQIGVATLTNQILIDPKTLISTP